MKAKNEIVKIIKKMDGKYSAYEIFSDWVEMCAIVIQNCCMVIHNQLWQKREDRYIQIANKYTEEEQNNLVYMYNLLLTALGEEMGDILGEIYMESGCGSKAAGQFFTPFSVSEAMAMLSVPNDVSEDKPYHMNEPSTGAGGMIIAVAKVLKNRGLNYQKCMEVVAQDLDWKAVHMTYLQLSLLGISATVVQGDTLIEPYANGYPQERVFYTPKKMGLLI